LLRKRFERQRERDRQTNRQRLIINQFNTRYIPAAAKGIRNWPEKNRQRERETNRERETDRHTDKQTEINHESIYYQIYPGRGKGNQELGGEEVVVRDD
jgi:hypothetical protein